MPLGSVIIYMSPVSEDKVYFQFSKHVSVYLSISSEKADTGEIKKQKIKRRNIESFILSPIPARIFCSSSLNKSPEDEREAYSYWDISKSTI